MVGLSCISVNVRGVGSTRRCGIVASVLSRFDVVFLQESYVDSVNKGVCFEREWGGKGFWCFGGERNAGVGIVLKDGLGVQVLGELRDTDGRVMSVLVEWGGVRYTFMCVYAPVDLRSRKQFFRNLYDYVFPGSLLVVGGDFNCVLRDCDSSCVSGANKGGAAELQNFITDLDLIDAWVLFHGRVPYFSWVGRGVGSRLDRVYLSRPVGGSLSSVFYEPLGISDHDGVRFCLQGGVGGRPRGLWKFNNGLLKDEGFVRDFREWLGREIRQGGQGGGEWEAWSSLKKRIKKYTIKYSREKAKWERLWRDCVTKELIRLKRALARGDGVEGEIERLEGELRGIVERKYEGVKVRSRAKWIEEGEKPTRFFFNLNREHEKKNRMDGLKDRNGVEKSEQGDMLNVVEEFYGELFCKEDVDSDVQEALLAKVERCLEEEASNRCEGFLNVAELEYACSAMSLGKAAGEDGLSLEFYRCFGDVLLPILCRVANESLDRGVLPEGMVRGVVRLVFKKGERADLRNWRPISLLNVDYKLIARSLGGRLKSVMELVVNDDQTCGVPGRAISDNLNLVRDVLGDVDRLDLDGVVLSLDQEKAFDRVDRVFLDKVLGRFGFGEVFRRWMCVLYEGASSRVLCNGELTGEVVLEKGIRQGCPLSPMLYVLVAEVLACNIRACEGVSGFLIPGSGGRTSVISQYADDATLILRNSYSMGKVLGIVDFFGKGTGAKLNRGKSEAMWVGRCKGKGEKPFGLKWVVKMKILGVWFGDNVRDENWVLKLQKLKGVLDRWKGRALSLKGRVLVVKVVGLTKLDHLARVLSVPRDVVREVNKLIWGFVWGGRVELIKRGTCLLPQGMGGLGMVCFETRIKALHVANVVSLLRRGVSKAFCYARYFVGNRISSLVEGLAWLQTNLLPSAGVLPVFYVDVLTSLRTFVVKSDCKLKSVYASMVGTLFVSPRSQRFWDGSVRGIVWKEVWRGFERSLSENIVSEVRWRAVQRVTKVRANLKEWGHNVVSDRCAVCRRVETVEHCFLECVRVRQAWGWVIYHIRSLVPRDFCINVSNVLLCLFNKGTGGHKVAVFVIECMLHVIWMFRNRATFDNSVVSYRALVRQCRFDIRCRLTVESSVLSDTVFRETWCIDDVLPAMT